MSLYAFDGTWNDSSSPRGPDHDLKATNVHRFRCMYDGDSHYIDGVGTRHEAIGKIIGGITGAGAETRIHEQFEILQRNFEQGKTDIDIVGYSRGAAIARMFVHRIGENFAELISAGSHLDQPPKVRFLGLFDTVASFGVPWTEDEGDFKRGIPVFVEHTFHAMALDETRETFGIERCLGNRDTITEIWFRGGHGDIGGNTTYVKYGEESSNRARSDLALNWMLSKARACGVPTPNSVGNASDEEEQEAPVTAKDEKFKLGEAGTLSRRIHLGDLVHYSTERTQLTRGIDGRLLRRIDVPTRLEDEELEKRCDTLLWTPPPGADTPPENEWPMNPSLIELSSRRYPFDVLPARTWRAWLELWELQDPGIGQDRLLEFWAPTEADRAVAWDIYVELKTRITTQELKDDEGDDETALQSVYRLFPMSREFFHLHGVDCANAAALITAFLNEKVRQFTALWHGRSAAWTPGAAPDPEFRQALRELQPTLRKLAAALSHLADARL